MVSFNGSQGGRVLGFRVQGLGVDIVLLCSGGWTTGGVETFVSRWVLGCIADLPKAPRSHIVYT